MKLIRGFKQVKILMVFLFLGALFFFHSCKKEDSLYEDDSLRICSPHPIEFIKPLIENFEYETGIKVQITQEGTGEILDKITKTAPIPYCDILWGGSLSIVLPFSHFFEHYQSSNEAYIEMQYRNVEGNLTRFTDVPSILMINRKVCGNVKIEGYKDLLQEELKGKIALCYPERSSSATEHLINILYAMGNGNCSESWEFVRQLCKNLDGIILSSSSQVYQGVAEGKFAVGLTFEDAGAKYARADENIELVYMEEGVLFTPDGIYVVKNTSNREKAFAFVDYMTSQKVQMYIVDLLHRRSVRSDIETPPSFVSKKNMKVIPVQYSFVSEHKQDWITRFNTILEEELR
ncbi:MAG TPA: extracellular solute-binding protein [Treponemataceae bacterium]|nr:extracellular solute-binding protein [Treponemataceae bacterium]